MIAKRNVAHYAKALAQIYELPEKDVRKVLVFMMKNATRMIEDGEDVRLMGLGHIFFDKKLYNEYLKRSKQKRKKP